MDERVDFSSLTPIRDMKGEDSKDSSLLKIMAKEAWQYMLSFDWCREIQAGWFGLGVGGVCAVFLFEILPATANIDTWLWVVVGDLPSAYLVIDECPTPIKALDTYLELMQEWVNAVKEGSSTEDCIPVNVSATAENADLLERRLTFIREKLLH